MKHLPPTAKTSYVPPPPFSRSNHLLYPNNHFPPLGYPQLSVFSTTRLALFLPSSLLQDRHFIPSTPEERWVITSIMPHFCSSLISHQNAPSRDLRLTKNILGTGPLNWTCGAHGWRNSGETPFQQGFWMSREDKSRIHFNTNKFNRADRFQSKYANQKTICKISMLSLCIYVESLGLVL